MKSRVLVPLYLGATLFLIGQVANASDGDIKLEEEEIAELTSEQVLLQGYNSFLQVYDNSKATEAERESAVGAFVEVLVGLLDDARGSADTIINRLVIEGESENLACELVGRAIKSLDKESDQRGEQENQTKFQNTISTIVHAQNQVLCSALISNQLDPLQKKLDEQASLIGDLSKQNTALSEKVDHFVTTMTNADHVTEHGDAFIGSIKDFQDLIRKNPFVNLGSDTTVEEEWGRRQEGFLADSSGEWGGEKNKAKLNGAVYKLLNATYKNQGQTHNYVTAPQNVEESVLTTAVSTLFAYAGSLESADAKVAAAACTTINTWLMNKRNNDLQQIQPLASNTLEDLRNGEDLSLADSVLGIILPLVKDLQELAAVLTPENEQTPVARPTAKLYRTIYELDTLLQLASKLTVVEPEPPVMTNPDEEEEINEDPSFTDKPQLPSFDSGLLADSGFDDLNPKNPTKQENSLNKNENNE